MEETQENGGKGIKNKGVGGECRGGGRMKEKNDNGG